MGFLTQKVRDWGQFGRSPVEVPPAPTAKKGAQGLGEWKSLLQFEGDDKHPATVYVSVFATGNNSDGGPIGPITARCDFGSGHTTHTFFFDLPINGVNSQPVQNTGDYQGGGIVFAVPASKVAVAVRNDAALIPPTGDVSLGALGANVVNPVASASMAEGNRPSTLLTRTVWGVQATPGHGLAAASTVTLPVPPYARRAVLIGDKSQTYQVTFTGPVAGDGPYNVAANAVSPEFVLGQAAFMLIKNTGGAEVLSVGAVFELGL